MKKKNITNIQKCRSLFYGHNTAHGRVVFEQLSTFFFSFVF